MNRVTLSLLAALGLWIAAPAAFADTPGDLNGDGAVDDVDKTIMTDAIGSAAGDAGFVAAADYDGDGAISLADLNIWMDLSGN